ncbi:MAG: SCO family protein [Planctomycetota bacterium]
MKVPLPLLISLSAGAVVCAVGAMIMLDRHRSAVPETSAADLDLNIPEFDLIDHNGFPTDESVLDGRLTLAAFIFTNCPGLCPLMTSTMAQAQDRLRDTDLRFASFSLDAERDTPEALRDFAAAHSADLTNWSMLTGNTETSRRLIRDGLRLIVEDEPENQVPTADGSTMANVLHPTRMILVGPDRRVLGFYSVSNVAELDRLEADVRSFFADRGT